MKKAHTLMKCGLFEAGLTRIELATSSVTDWRSNQAELQPRSFFSL